MPSLTFSSSFFSPFHAHQRQPPQQQQQLLDDIFADVDLAERDEDEEEEEKLETGTRDADGTKKKKAKEDDGGGRGNQNPNPNGAAGTSEWDTPMTMTMPRGGGAAAAAATRTATDRSTERLLIPWRLPPPSLRSHLLRLHNEILSFWAFTRPTRREALARTAAAQKLRSLVSAIWPGEEVAVEVFGSSATGLALPGSDIDVVVRGATGGGDAATRLRALAAALARSGVARDLQLISRARVPLVKYVDAASGLPVDVSFDEEGGPAAARRAVSALDSLPAARPLLSVLKAALAQRDLNEVYTGGLGSYALLVMVVAFLQGHRSRYYGGGGGGKQKRPATTATATTATTKKSSSSTAASPLEPCLGTLILEFCALYGRQLDYDNVGVRMLMEEEEDKESKAKEKEKANLVGGVFFAKTKQQRANSPRPGALTVLDPCDPANDLSGGSFHVARVRSAFDHIGTLLSTPLPEGAVGGGERCSLLARCIRVDGALRGREREGDAPFSSSSAAAEEEEEEEEEEDGAPRGEREQEDSGKKRRRAPLPPPLPRSSPPQRRQQEAGRKKREAREGEQEEGEFGGGGGSCFPRGDGGGGRGGGGQQEQQRNYYQQQHRTHHNQQQQQQQYYRARGGGGRGRGRGRGRF